MTPSSKPKTCMILRHILPDAGLMFGESMKFKKVNGDGNRKTGTLARTCVYYNLNFQALTKDEFRYGKEIKENWIFNTCIMYNTCITLWCYP